ncbi:hypothetical protein SAE02_18440 [Skermanella aerolata]|uniref:GAF domain-containing protein n=1 Tax=Skermanella aerolata TaxID=393310 RepID=A0A512DMK0_9PROT|nr:GAF domain-containing protein [Skermanella aerolata]GEO37696.1 hypothetical protein SAE02_18440 [Skermanella aerolata]
MNDPMIFPPALLPIVEQKLRERLLSYVQPGVPRCLLAFVGDGEIEVKRQFTTDHDWRIWHTDLEDGLIGEALRTGQIVEWDEKRPNTPFLKGDPRTIYEIAASISFKDKATAVLLIDYFKEDPADRAHHWKIQGWRGEIAEILATPEREETEIRNHILNAVQVSVDQTKSIRGYIALKQWDGTIRYFTAGQGRDKFRYLSQLEGICGEVMRTGVFQNVGNVWNHPQYRSSDDSIQSEAVAPIKVRGDECIGVLNLESAEANHYTPEREAAILRSADEIIDLADRFRRPVGVDIGAHSLLLSDLVEQFSAPEDNTRLPNEERIWEWAEELCRRKITSLEGVIDATFVDVSVGAEDGRRMRF